MKQFTCKITLLLAFLSVSMFGVGQHVMPYNKVITQKFDKEELKVKEQTVKFQSGVVTLGDKHLTVDGVGYIIVKEVGQQNKNGYTYRSVVLCPEKTNNHRVYDCILSYKTTNDYKNNIKPGLYAVEFWRSDLTCIYYFLQ